MELQPADAGPIESKAEGEQAENKQVEEEKEKKEEEKKEEEKKEEEKKEEEKKEEEKKEEEKKEEEKKEEEKKEEEKKEEEKKEEEKPEAKEEPPRPNWVLSSVGYGILQSVSEDGNTATLKLAWGRSAHTQASSLQHEVDVHIMSFATDKRSFTFKMKPSDTIAELKAKIWKEHRGVEMESIRLAYNGKELKNESDCIAECDIRPPFSVIHFQEGPSFITLEDSHHGELSVVSNRMAHLESEHQRWFTVRGVMPDRQPLTRGVHKWEFNIDTTRSGYILIGVCNESSDRRSWLGADENSWGYMGDGTFRQGNAARAYGPSFASGDVIGVVVDLDNRNLSFTKNGVDLGVACNGLPKGLYPAVSLYNAGDQISVFRDKSYPYADRSNIVSMRTFRGNRVELDISRATCTPFNFFPGDKIFDKNVNSEGMVVGVAIAPARFKGCLFMVHNSRSGLGGWNAGEAERVLELRERADANLSTREALQSVFSNDANTYVENQAPPQFQHHRDEDYEGGDLEEEE